MQAYSPHALMRNLSRALFAASPGTARRRMEHQARQRVKHHPLFAASRTRVKHHPLLAASPGTARRRIKHQTRQPSKHHPWFAASPGTARGGMRQHRPCCRIFIGRSLQTSDTDALVRIQGMQRSRIANNQTFAFAKGWSQWGTATNGHCR